jgi:mono/diheme cytochrome c family protein
MKLHSITRLAALALVAFWAAGSGSTSFSAPPVTPEKPADDPHSAGRSLYLNSCNRCHALPDVRSYSAPRLTAIVAKMSRKAKMTPEQHDAVLNYLLTLRSL